jgi:hypothetical protein
VHQDVAEAGQTLQLAHQVGGEPGIPPEVPHRFGVVLEPIPAPGGEVTGEPPRA